MDIHDKSPNSVILKAVRFETMHGRTYVAELYDHPEHQHMVLTTENPHAQAVFLRTIDSRGLGPWEDLCIFPSEVDDEAADVCAEAEAIMDPRFYQHAHLAILECHPTNNTSYTIRRGTLDEETNMLREASGWAKQVSAYKDIGGKPFPTSTIRLVTYNPSGVIELDTHVH